MATDKPTTYPKISKRIWTLLRGRFSKAMPSVVGPDYIISMSEMTDASARSNVLSPLRDLGILDKDNRPTEIAQRWRHDDEYENVCREIRSTVYPPALVEAFPEGDTSQKEGIKRWFMKNSRVGENAGRMFADTYMLLSSAALPALDNDGKPSVASKQPRGVKSDSRAKASTVGINLPPSKDELSSTLPVASPAARKLPSVHIDVQVHISPETTPEQIDRIFESMSKHLGSFIG